jgi:hypothetical protein
MALSQFSIVTKIKVARPRPLILYLWAGNGRRPVFQAKHEMIHQSMQIKDQASTQVSREFQIFTVRRGGSHLKTDHASTLVNNST